MADQRVTALKEVVHTVQPDFEKLAKIHGAVNWEREAAFAMQIIAEKPFLQSTAMGNKDSLRQAVINVAAIGLTLNPALKLAYLVPRDGKVCLEVSYLGLKQLAEESGAIDWEQAHLVRQNDVFELREDGIAPFHQRNAFATEKERGPIVGAYSVAKTPKGDRLTTTMSLEDLHKIRGKSPAWKKNKSGPWKTDEGEMMKKTVIRRAYKGWPRAKVGAAGERLARAVALVDDEHSLEPEVIEVDPKVREKGLEEIREHLKRLNRTEEKFVDHMMRQEKRDIKKLDDLTASEVERANVFLRGIKPGEK